jgi:hypothetical protein
MDDPTLTDWRALYTTTRERFPDAPGLPEGYSFVPDDIDGGSALLYEPYLQVEPSDAALCVMLDWAIRFGAWWVQQRRKGAFSVEHVWNYGWTVDVTDYTERGVEEILSTIGGSTGWSHHAAYFAAAQAIGRIK